MLHITYLQDVDNMTHIGAMQPREMNVKLRVVLMIDLCSEFLKVILKLLKVILKLKVFLKLTTIAC